MRCCSSLIRLTPDCRQLTDAVFAHLKGTHTLLMQHCNQPTITDAALVHLKGIKCLVLWGCSIPFTEVGLIHLQGISRLHMGDANAASIAAARAWACLQPQVNARGRICPPSASATKSQPRGLRALSGIEIAGTGSKTKKIHDTLVSIASRSLV